MTFFFCSFFTFLFLKKKIKQNRQQSAEGGGEGGEGGWKDGDGELGVSSYYYIYVGGGKVGEDR
jgi:hypothetical protein